MIWYYRLTVNILFLVSFSIIGDADDDSIEDNGNNNNNNNSDNNDDDDDGSEWDETVCRDC